MINYYIADWHPTIGDRKINLIYKCEKGKWYCKWSGTHTSPGDWNEINNPVHYYKEITEKEAFLELI